jgi:hypothetical protein
MKAFPVVLAALLATLPSSIANADDTDDSALATSLHGEAKELYRLARDLFAKGDHAAALSTFTRVHELSADARLYWNMAACEARLKHWARALTLLDRYKTASGTLSQRDRERVERFQNAATPLVCIVDLTGVPKGVSLSVDGESIGVTPVSVLYLDPGKRRVHFAQPGYRGFVRVAQIEPGTKLAWPVVLERMRVRIIGN